ncbi:hypothetical protein GCM10023405_35470 [Streptomonospora salina]
MPRFKLENHIKELELYNKIREFLKVGNVLLTTPSFGPSGRKVPSGRVYRENSNPTVVLEINKIKELRDILIPLMFNKDCLLLQTLKAKDFTL